MKSVDKIAALVHSAQRGDRKAFTQLVGLYQERVRAVSYSHVGNVALVNDVAPERFVVAWRIESLS